MQRLLSSIYKLSLLVYCLEHNFAVAAMTSSASVQLPTITSMKKLVVVTLLFRSYDSPLVVLANS
jgi:hypothetical protein